MLIARINLAPPFTEAYREPVSKRSRAMSSTMKQAGLDEVIGSIDQQIGWSRTLGSPFTANMLELIRDNIRNGGALAPLVVPWNGPPVEDVVALRLSGVVQMMARTGRAPSLARFYPTGGESWDSDVIAAEIEKAVATNIEFVRSILSRPPQTNEVGRSAVLMPAYVQVARATGLPLRILEVGASAGLNLMWDRFHYELGGHHVGDPKARVTVRAEWQGPWPGITSLPHVVERQGCDRTPIDLAAEGEADRLMSYMWPDQTERVERLEGAIALARQDKPRLEQADAGEWLERMLAEPVHGVATIIAHSIAWTYFSQETSARGRRAIEQAGARATRKAPLAWVAFEHVAPNELPALTLTTWPGGEEKLLARAHPHGSSVHWLAE
jgi:hypothetical protein